MALAKRAVHTALFANYFVLAFVVAKTAANMLIAINSADITKSQSIPYNALEAPPEKARKQPKLLNRFTFFIVITTTFFFDIFV